MGNACQVRSGLVRSFGLGLSLIWAEPLSTCKVSHVFLVRYFSTINGMKSQGLNLKHTLFLPALLMKLEKQKKV